MSLQMVGLLGPGLLTVESRQGPELTKWNHEKFILTKWHDKCSLSSRILTQYDVIVSTSEVNS